MNTRSLRYIPAYALPLVYLVVGCGNDSGVCVCCLCVVMVHRHLVPHALFMLISVLCRLSGLRLRMGWRDRWGELLEWKAWKMMAWGGKTERRKREGGGGVLKQGERI